MKGGETLKETGFLRVEQVMEEMQISKQTAYKIIRKLNDELADMGYITVQGRVNADYFYERCRYNGGKEAQQ